MHAQAQDAAGQQGRQGNCVEQLAVSVCERRLQPELREHGSVARLLCATPTRQMQADVAGVRHDWDVANL